MNKGRGLSGKDEERKSASWKEGRKEEGLVESIKKERKLGGKKEEWKRVGLNG